MTKVALLAPEGHSGTIHGSHSGQAYDIDADGLVVVDQADAGPLLMHGGYQHAPRKPGKSGTEGDTPQEIQSRSPGSTELGASALDPDKRQQFQRHQGVEVQDHAGAQPLFGDGGNGSEPGAGTDGQREAKANDELRERQSSGGDTSQTSQVPGTGHLADTRVSQGGQEQARKDGAQERQGDKPATPSV